MIKMIVCAILFLALSKYKTQPVIQDSQCDHRHPSRAFAPSLDDSVSFIQQLSLRNPCRNPDNIFLLIQNQLADRVVSPLAALRFPRSQHAPKRHYVQPAASSPLKINDVVMGMESAEIMNIRREGPPIPSYSVETPRGQKKPRKVKDYDVKVLSLDNLKSLELDDSLENYLTLDAQEKQRKGKKNVGFKVVNLNDFDTDRQKSKKSKIKKVKLVQSLAPPKSFFKKYVPNEIINDESTDDSWNVYANKFTSTHGNQRNSKSKSIFDENGMMFLTKPKDVEGRKLNSLINKVLNIQDKQGLHGNLRQPKKVFTPDEMKQIKVIAQAIEEEDKDEDQNNELDQLLLSELLHGEVKESPKGDVLAAPIEITVAEVSPQTRQIKVLQSLQLNDGNEALYRNNNQNDEFENEAIVRLISQLLNLQRKDDDVDEELAQAQVKVRVLNLPDTVAESARIAINHKAEDEKQEFNHLKQIARAIQDAQQNAEQEAAPAAKVDQQFNFEDLVA